MSDPSATLPKSPLEGPLRIPRVTNALIGGYLGFAVVDLFSGGIMSSLGLSIPGFLWGNGEWQRLLFASFLHASPFHLAVNVFLLFVVGSLTERLYGRLRILFVYLVSGAAAAIASAAVRPADATAAASGASLGLVGLLLGLTLVRRALPLAALERRTALIIAIGVLLHLVFGIFEPYVNNLVHFAGLATGFLLAATLEARLPARCRPIEGVAAGLVLAGLLGGLLWRSESRVAGTLPYAMLRAEFFDASRQFSAAIEVMESAFEQSGNGSANHAVRPLAQNLLAWLYVETGSNLEEGIRLSEESNRDHRNVPAVLVPAFLDTLGYLYAMTGRCRDAADAMGRAADLDARYGKRRDEVNRACEGGARPDPDVPLVETDPPAPTPAPGRRGIRV